jgi:IS30 family transposase
MGKIYEQLSIEERAMIQTQLKMGYRLVEIAASLSRSPSTICRELRRNGWNQPVMPRGRGRPTVAGGYRAEAVHTRAQACAAIPRVERRYGPAPLCGIRSGALPEGGVLARADCWHTGGCAS